MAYVVGHIEKNSPLLSGRCLLVIANEMRQSPGEPTGRHCAHRVSFPRTCTLQGIAMTNLLPTGRSLRRLAMTKDVSPAGSFLVIANEVRQSPGEPTGRHCAHRVSLRRTCTLQGIAMTNLLPTGRSLCRLAMTNLLPTGRHCAHWVSIRKTCTLQGIALTKNMSPASGLSCRWRDRRCH